MALPPHIFEAAAGAFAAMAADDADQSILVSGESGAGKTESCKLLIKFFARVGSDLANPDHMAISAGAKSAVTIGVEQRILQCNPLLEALGNATTPRNDNSSRYGPGGPRALAALTVNLLL